MKAILCTNGAIDEVDTWFEFEECKQFVLQTIPQNSTVVVDDKLFENLNKLGLTENFNVIVFDSKKNFKNVRNCKTFRSLGKQLFDCEKKNGKVFLLSGSRVFEKLLPYCSTMTIANFNLNQKKFPLRSSLDCGIWFEYSKPINKKDCVIAEKTNMKPISYSFMAVEDAFRMEDLLKQKQKSLEQSQKQNSQKQTEKTGQDKSKTFLDKVVKSKEAEKLKKQEQNTKQTQKTSQNCANTTFLNKLVKSKDVKEQNMEQAKNTKQNYANTAFLNKLVKSKDVKLNKQEEKEQITKTPSKEQAEFVFAKMRKPIAQGCNSQSKSDELTK